MDPSVEARSEIAFFDLETTRHDQEFAILEFGAIVLCSHKLVELSSYSTLVQPANVSLINSLSVRSNGITPDAISSAPTFSEIADIVFDILQGRIWAGHNILRFDCDRIRKAFAELGRAAPEPKGTIDSLALLKQRFGKRAGDMKLASLATYFGLGQQTHRSLDDVRMNLQVMKNCATLLFLESSLPDIFTVKSWVSPCEGSSSGGSGFLDPEEVFIHSIAASYFQYSTGIQIIKLLHKDVILQLCCAVKVRFGARGEYTDFSGRPKLSFVAYTSPALCQVLDACDAAAHKLSLKLGSSSIWKPVIKKEDFFSTIRLHIPTIYTDNPRYETEIYKKESSGALEKLVLSPSDEASEIEALITTGITLEAYFSLDYYDYQQNVGIRLVAKKLVIN